MIHQKTGFHHLLRFIRRWALYLLPVFTIACNHSNYDTLPREGAINLLGRINQLRAGQDLVPLQMDDALNGTATARAWKVASGGPDEPDEATLKRMTDAGIFARFALSCVTRGESVEAAMNRVFDDPLSASRVSHGGVTHIGMNIARSGGTIVLVLDMARLVPAADPETITGKLIEDIRTRRERIGVAPLAMDNTLNDAAVQLVSDFMNRADTSDSLIAKAQASLASNNFNLGKITVAFQVVGIPGDIVVPERTSDPGAAAMGISVRQGNHPDHDPGAVAVAIFLMVKGINRMRRKEEEAPASPPPPSKEEVLLTEIRDLLAKKV